MGNPYKIRPELENSVIDWVKSNCEPDDVFDDDDLITYVSENNDPEDIFDEEALSLWATENGFTKIDPHV